MGVTSIPGLSRADQRAGGLADWRTGGLAAKSRYWQAPVPVAAVRFAPRLMSPESWLAVSA